MLFRSLRYTNMSELRQGNMSELREGEDPFFSSIRALKAMLHPMSTQLDLRSTNEGEGTRDIAQHDLRTPCKSLNVQVIRHEIIDLQSKLQEAEEIAVERERDEIHHSIEQERLELLSSLKAAEESVTEEKLLQLATEQLLLTTQLERKVEQEKFAMEVEIRSNLEQEIHDLQNKLKVAEVTIDDVQSEKISLDRQFHEVTRVLKEKEKLLACEKLMRLAAAQERFNLQSKVKSAAEAAELEIHSLQSSLNDANESLSKERVLRLAMEHERDEICLEFEEMTKDLQYQKTLSNQSPQVETPVRNTQLVDDLNARLRAAEATAEKEKQQRLALEQERDEILLECREARTLFESPIQDDPYLLKKETQRLLATRNEERKKHLKEMDRIHLQLQGAISQRDSMEARLQGSKKVTDNLSNELEKAYAKIRELKGEDEGVSIINNSASGKHGRSDGDDPISITEDNETVNGIISNEDNDQLHACKYSKLSD